MNQCTREPLMFITPELQHLPRIFNLEHLSETVQHRLSMEYMNLEGAILRAKVVRAFGRQNLHYLIQDAVQEQDVNLGYVFSPFIFANLNKPCIYSTPNTAMIENILERFGQVDYKIKADYALDAMHMYLDIRESTYSDTEMLQLGLLRALCRPDLKHVFLITDTTKLNTQAITEIEQFLKIHIHPIHKQRQSEWVVPVATEIKLKKLLFKHKDVQYMALCEYFSQQNAELLKCCDSLKLEQNTRLIEDMFYSEHIFEKMSVYSEYIQTLSQNALHG
ncbi:hypothetical protein ACX1N1_14905 [Acinetobacter sp. ANC 3791]|nr:hypothetical protein E0H90_14335 [Acinetobacter sp. ANC 3791]